MFFSALILCGFWIGALGSETACEVLAEKDCPLHNIVPPETFPGYFDELEADCQKLKKLKDCIKNSVKKCMDDGSGDLTVDKGALERLKENKRMIELTSEICETRSPLHSKFVQDMSCFKSVTVAENKDSSCTDYAEKVRAHLQSRINLKIKKIPDDVGRNPIYKCLEVLADFNCFVSKFNDKCGSRAKDTALEIIEKGASLDVQCPDDIRIDMLELVDAWKTVSKKGVFIRELILSDL